MTTVLLYSHRNDPVVQALLNNKVLKIIALSLQELLEECLIFDEVNNGTVKLKWELSNGISISNTEDFYLINRVLAVPESLFENFHEQDKKYAAAEFKAYLMFALESFPKISSKPSAFGLSGSRFSLPRQWELIKKEKFDLKIPEYYLGSMELCPFNDKFDNVVFSSPYNYYYWKPNKGITNLQKSSFAFIRPPGKPVIASIIGSKTYVFSHFHEDSLSIEQQKEIEDYAGVIAKLFNYSVAESMFLCDENSIFFGMISNISYVSHNKEWFNDAVITAVCNEIGFKRDRE